LTIEFTRTHQEHTLNDRSKPTLFSPSVLTPPWIRRDALPEYSKDTQY
jgi:hypothetical protein